MNKENVTAKADFRHQLDTLIADNNRLHMELAQAINKQNAIQMQAKQIEQVHFLNKAVVSLSYQLRNTSDTSSGYPPSLFASSNNSGSKDPFPINIATYAVQPGGLSPFSVFVAVRNGETLSPPYGSWTSRPAARLH